MLIDCNCIEDLGCFVFDPNALSHEIIFPFTASLCAGEYTFFVMYRGRTDVIKKSFVLNEQITLENTFDETAELMIKIKFPGCVLGSQQAGFNFLTSEGGACVFKVKNSGNSC